MINITAKNGDYHRALLRFRYVPLRDLAVMGNRQAAELLFLSQSNCDLIQRLTMITSIQQCYFDVVSVIYPRLCLACGRQLPPRQDILCLHCDFRLPKTDFHEHRENLFTDRFWGRISLKAASSYLYFRKGSLAQQLIHRLKYDQKREIGAALGQRYGRVLSGVSTFREVDCIVPVPLHPYKEKKRGYNQSAVFGQGLAEAMHLPCHPHALRRRLMTETQTRKSRFDRINNVGEVFEPAQEPLLRGKHILLVDDVVTTGATLEACALSLLEIPGTSVSMATIGFAMI